ncbi:MAG: hypothetical protein ACRDZO_08005 [Egibacteraceae bacterium]
MDTLPRPGRGLGHALLGDRWTGRVRRGRGRRVQVRAQAAANSPKRRITSPGFSMPFNAAPGAVSAAIRAGGRGKATVARRSPLNDHPRGWVDPPCPDALAPAAAWP